MSVDPIVAARLKTIIEWMNNVNNNSKKTEELPSQESLDLDSLIRVSRDGISEKVTLEQIITLAQATSSDQNNRVTNAFLGIVSEENTFDFILDHAGITVAPDEIVIISVLQPTQTDSEIPQYIQRLFIWKLGKGTYSPIGSSDIQSKMLELPSIYPSQETVDEIILNPAAVVREYGDIESDIITAINSKNPAVAFDDSLREYYVRATIQDTNFLWQFVGELGIYGFGQLQMEPEDLVLIFSSGSAGGSVQDMNSVKKTSFGERLISSATPNLILNLDDVLFRNTFRILATGNGVIRGVNIITTTSDIDSPYPGKGKIFHIINNTGLPLTLENMYAVVEGLEVPFKFSKGSNLVMKNNEIATFRENTNNWECISFSGEITPALISKPQVAVTGDVVANNSWNGAIVKVKASATITIPIGLDIGFEFDYATYTGATATLAPAVGVTLNASSSLILQPLKMGTVWNDGTNIYEIRGEQN